MSRLRILPILGGALLFATATLPAQSERKLELSFQDGTVTLAASNVTVREILAEWTRKGGTRIINGDRLQGGLVTLQYDNAPERLVMDSLLRAAAGYILGPRLEASAGASEFGVVSILPTSQAVAGPSNSTFMSQPPLRTSPDDEVPPVTPPIGALDPRQSNNAPPATAGAPAENTPPRPTVGSPASGVVPIVPVPPSLPPPTTGRGGGGGTVPPPPSGGRGGGGGGGGGGA